MSGPVCPVCGGPWHAVCPAAEVIGQADALMDLAWRGACALLNLSVIMTIVIILGTLLV